MNWGDIAFVAFYAATIGALFGYSRGYRAATEQNAKATELGLWLAKAMQGVHDNHKFHGDGIATTSTGRAKFPSGETFVVSVEMERP